MRRLDQLAQALRRAQLAAQRPDVVALHERVLGARAEHELAEREHVAATRPPQGAPPRPGVSGPSSAMCSNVSTSISSSSPRSIRAARSSRHHRVTASGTGAPTTTVAMQNSAPCDISRSTTVSDEASSAVSVVEQQHRDAGLVGGRHEHAAGRLEQPGEHRRVETVAAQTVERVGRHQVGDGAERQRLRRRIATGPHRASAGGTGALEALVAEAGLADTWRAVHAEALAAGIGRARGGSCPTPRGDRPTATESPRPYEGRA